MTTQQRAQVGGQIGANGEWYEGGEFIATTDAAKLAKKLAADTAKYMGKKQEIAPYIWALPPTETARRINIFNGVFLKMNRETGLVAVVEYNGPMGGFGYTAEELAEMWNAGVRWVEPK